MGTQGFKVQSASANSARTRNELGTREKEENEYLSAVAQREKGVQSSCDLTKGRGEPKLSLCSERVGRVPHAIRSWEKGKGYIHSQHSPGIHVCSCANR